MVYVCINGEFCEGVDINKIFSCKENAIEYAKKQARDFGYVEKERNMYLFYAERGCEFFAVESWEVE